MTRVSKGHRIVTSKIFQRPFYVRNDREETLRHCDLRMKIRLRIVVPEIRQVETPCKCDTGRLTDTYELRLPVVSLSDVTLK